VHVHCDIAYALFCQPPNRRIIRQSFDIIDAADATINRSAHDDWPSGIDGEFDLEIQRGDALKSRLQSFPFFRFFNINGPGP
jgi:hypothetical protein